MINTSAADRAETEALSGLRAAVTHRGQLTAPAFGTVIEGAPVSTGLFIYQVRAYLFGDSGAVLAKSFTDLFEFLPVVKPGLYAEPVFTAHMLILVHMVLLFWSEQQVETNVGYYRLFGRIKFQPSFRRINFRF
ncbi:MAG: hypothetical protein LKE85_14220 [Lachnospiraceae bacterium]|nr:hypothetical protein [Lachnospiraceae bacterium]MCH4035115.1 hypothetical protein [Lachnospiraceae bacterium]